MDFYLLVEILFLFSTKPLLHFAFDCFEQVDGHCERDDAGGFANQMPGGCDPWDVSYKFPFVAADKADSEDLCL